MQLLTRAGIAPTKSGVIIQTSIQTIICSTNVTVLGRPFHLLFRRDSEWYIFLLFCKHQMFVSDATYVPQCDDACDLPYLRRIECCRFNFFLLRVDCFPEMFSVNKASCEACTEDVVMKERHTAGMIEINRTRDFIVTRSLIDCDSQSC